MWIVDVATPIPETELAPWPEGTLPAWSTLIWMMIHRRIWFADTKTASDNHPSVFHYGFPVPAFRVNWQDDDFVQLLRRRVRRSRADTACTFLASDVERLIRLSRPSSQVTNDDNQECVDARFESTLRHLIWRPEDFSGVAAVATAAGLSVRQLERRMRSATLVPVSEFRRTLLALHADNLLNDWFSTGDVARELRYGPIDALPSERIRALRRHLRAVTGVTALERLMYGQLFYPYWVFDALRRPPADDVSDRPDDCEWEAARALAKHGAPDTGWPFWGRDIVLHFQYLKDKWDALASGSPSVS